MINEYSMFENNPLGITLRNIFKVWPDTKIFEVFRYSTAELEDGRIKIKSYKLPSNSLPIDYIIRRILHKEIKEPQLTSFQIPSNEKISFKHQIIMSAKYITESLFVFRRNSEIDQELARFNPEVIYTNGESLFSLKVCLHFSRLLNIPIVIHYMDNWRETLYPKTGLLKIFHYLFSRNLRLVEDRMKNGLVISPKMKLEYSLQNSKVKYSVLLNPVPGPFQRKNCQPANKEIIFSYIGGLHLSRWESLLEVERCICELNQAGMPSKLYIYTPQVYSTEFADKYNHQFTIFKGYLPPDEVNNALQDADILVHVEAFNSQVTKYTQYSLSTKIPEYMAAGKPILCYAPRFLSVSEYIENTKSGISTDTYKDLLQAAVCLSTDINLRAELGNNGLSTVINAHSPQRALETLMDSL
jgi:glycosyltransferase involved in cell wall biosynthesis